MRFDDVKESALMAFDTLRSNKLRSALTILGVSVGVITVIFMVSIIQGLNKAFADQIESFRNSSRALAVHPGRKRFTAKT
jgi:putative ABC transport system permease protein